MNKQFWGGVISVVVVAVELPLVAVDEAHNYGFYDYIPSSGVYSGTNCPPKDAIYRNASVPIEERIDDVLKYMTPQEMMHILHMTSGASAGDLPRIGLANIRAYDGPNGSRCEKPITYLPSCIAYAASWDRDLACEAAAVMGRENRAAWAGSKEIGRMLLGPGCDIARSPTGARNFEYFGEDPVLSGETAAAFCLGLQSVKVAPCLKHYVLNDQEWARTVADIDCPERALREIYVRPFEIAVRKADVWSIMNSYNQVRGEWMSHNLAINNYLREAGWTGALVPDWGGYHGDVKAINGGTTFESGCKADDERDKRELELLKNGTLNAELVAKAVRDTLRFFFRVGAFDSESAEEKALQAECVKKYLGPEHRAVAYRAAAESLVMLKNENEFLPLERGTVKTVCVVGPNADKTHSMIGGKHLKDCGGSGAVLALREPTPLEVARAVFGRKNVYTDIADAAKADLVIYFGGFNHHVDREVLGWGIIENADRKDIALDERQLEEIAALGKANERLVVALTTGAPVKMEPWEDSAKAVFVRWYAGEEGAAVFFDTLFGEVNPSGKLPFTFGRKLDDWYCHRLGEKAFPGVKLAKMRSSGSNRVEAEEYYADGIWVGYRGFDKFGIKPKYPFGFGLSYTTWSFAAAGQTKDSVKVKVTNTGKRAGRCVVQCYASKPQSAGVEMPEKELVDFASVKLAAGETKMVEFKLGFEQLKYFDEAANEWRMAKGKYKISVGGDSKNRPVVFEWER